MNTKENRNLTGHHQPQIGGKHQTILMDPAITAVTDELVVAFNRQAPPEDEEDEEDDNEDDFPAEEDLEEDDFDLNIDEEDDFELNIDNK